MTGSDGTSTEYVWRRARFANDSNSTFLGWTNIDSVDAGVYRSARADVRYYPTGSKVLLQVHTGQTTKTVLTPFEQCPWATDINGVNTEECRSFRVEAEAVDTKLHELDLASGQQRFLVTVPGRELFASAVSESEDQIMLIEASRRSDYEQVPRTDGTPGWTFTNSHSTTDQCQASWHSVPAGTGNAVERHRVHTPDMCFSIFGGGTIAPLVGQHLNGMTFPFRGLRGSTSGNRR